MKVIKIKIFAAFSQTGCNTVIADTSKLLNGGCFADILVKYVKDAPKICKLICACLSRVWSLFSWIRNTLLRLSGIKSAYGRRCSYLQLLWRNLTFNLLCCWNKWRRKTCFSAHGVHVSVRTASGVVLREDCKRAALEGIKSAARWEKHSSRSKCVLINQNHTLKGQKAPNPSPLPSVCQTGDFLSAFIFKFTLKFQYWNTFPSPSWWLSSFSHLPF